MNANEATALGCLVLIGGPVLLFLVAVLFGWSPIVGTLAVTAVVLWVVAAVQRNKG